MTSRFVPIVILILVIACIGVNAIASATTPEIHVGVHAAWAGQSSTYAEAAELMAAEGRFWEYVVALGAGPTEDRAAYVHAMKTAGEWLSPAELAVLNTSLALRVASPKVELFSQIRRTTRAHFAAVQADAAKKNVAVTCDINKATEWAHVGPRMRLVCSPDHLAAAVKTECGNDVEAEAQAQADVVGTHPEAEAEADTMGGSNFIVPATYIFDHVYNGAYGPVAKMSCPVILFAAVGTSEFVVWHKTILSLMAQYQKEKEIEYVAPISYVLRHGPPLNNGVDGRGRIPLSGFGVELNLRKTEYKLWEEKEKPAGDVDADIDADVEIDPLVELAKMGITKRDVDDLGLAATAEIVGSAMSTSTSTSTGPLETLRDIAQNLPVKAYGLLQRMREGEARGSAEVEVEGVGDGQRYTPPVSSVRNELDRLQGSLFTPGQSSLFLNGRQLESQDGLSLDMYGVLDMVRDDTKLLSALHDGAHVSVDSAHNLLLQSASVRARGQGPGSHGQRKEDESEAVRIDVRSDDIMWLNDVDTDPRFNGWGTGLRSLLRPMYPGQIAPVRRNVYNVVLCLDPLSQSAARALDTVNRYIQASSPVRFGVVWQTSVGVPERKGQKQLSSMIARCFIQLKRIRGIEDALSFVGVVARLVEVDPMAYAENWNNPEMERVISQIYDEHRQDAGDDFELVAMSTELDSMLRGMTKLLTRTNLGIVVPCALLNGVLATGENSLETIGPMIMEEFLTIKEHVKHSRLVDGTSDLHAAIIELENAFPRFHPRVMPPKKSGIFYKSLLKLKLPHDAYVTSQFDSDKVYSKTLIVATDLESVHGKALIEHGRAILDLPAGMDVRFAAIDHADPFCTDVLGLDGSSGVIFNGRYLSLSPEEASGFTTQDFELLLKFEWDQLGRHVSERMDELLVIETDPDKMTNAFISDSRMIVMSIIAPDIRRVERRFVNPVVFDATSVAKVHLPGSGLMRVTGFLDPLSTHAQRFADLIMLMKNHFDASVTMVLNPARHVGAVSGSGVKGDERAELPLKSFYRTTVMPAWADMFDAETGARSNKPTVIFKDMPADNTLTLNPHVPEAWLVDSAEASVDLDNIRLEKGATQPVKAEYELSRLVVTGHCFDEAMQPPRGLQVEMGPINPDAVSFVPDTDTLVMSNLGYFQLKAAPGLWHLRIAPGRGSDIFEIDHHSVFSPAGGEVEIDVLGGSGGSGSGSGSTRVLVVRVDNLAGGPTINLRVHRRDGMQSVSLLEEDGPQQGQGQAQAPYGGEGEGEWEDDSWGKRRRAPRALNPDGSGTGRIEDVKVINIFSLASGHLYERLAKIMMMSVVRNTHTPVKFWFIEQYLSPQFKEILPCMAEKYNFSYGLVSYKWPSWLQKQEEKMRTIWAYKVLFLDVLFPLNVTRVITVDADQVIRADMAELMALDLKGASLAYTPFCDSKEDMDGFRFWKRGFWQSHLRGKPYHISALYVTDLVKYRQMAAGDMFRIAYESLSKQEDSLSNLDQDLPNYMQHRVPIYSLPQEWLWCESWCSADTLSKAKTIDLCNNPLTKANKLDVARQQIAEWPALDKEAGLLGNLRRGADGKCESGSGSEVPVEPEEGVKEEL